MSSTNLLQAWIFSKTWKVRPSEFYGIEHEYPAYCFDRAITLWGLAYEADIQEVADKAKSESAAKAAIAMAQHRWLTDAADDDDDHEPAETEADHPAPTTSGDTGTKPKFSDPAELFGVKHNA